MTVTISRLYDSCNFLTIGFQHRFSHLLYEQRNAVGALDDFLSDASGQRLVACDAVRRSRHGLLELALPLAASSGYSLDLGCSRYRATAPSLPPDGLWLQRLVLRLAARRVVLLVH